jgi:hypothetical protein
MKRMLNETVIAWLLESSNPAVAYRTQTELLDQTADKAPVVKWLTDLLPDKWEETKGLWFVYYLTAFAECGLKHEDTGVDAETLVRYKSTADFDYGCAIICTCARWCGSVLGIILWSRS